MTNKSLTLLALSVLSFSSVQAQSLLVGWDRFNNPAAGTTTNTPGFAATDFDGSFTVSGTLGSEWSRLAEGSNDGTFGTFAGPPTADNTNTDSFYGALQVKNSNANGFTLSFTIENNSLVDYALSSVEFDVWRSFSNSPSTVDVSVSSGSITNGLITTTAAFTVQSGAATANANDYQDISISLSGLADTVLEAGQSATIALTVNDQKVGKTAATLFDNIGITGTAIPESGSYALIAGLFGLASIMMRRRN
jgi:hypothetical protein